MDMGSREIILLYLPFPLCWHLCRAHSTKMPPTCHLILHWSLHRHINTIKFFKKPNNHNNQCKFYLMFLIKQKKARIVLNFDSWLHLFLIFSVTIGRRVYSISAANQSHSCLEQRLINFCCLKGPNNKCFRLCGNCRLCGN